MEYAALADRPLLDSLRVQPVGCGHYRRVYAVVGRKSEPPLVPQDFERRSDRSEEAATAEGHQQSERPRLSGCVILTDVKADGLHFKCEVSADEADLRFAARLPDDELKTLRVYATLHERGSSIALLNENDTERGRTETLAHSQQLTYFATAAAFLNTRSVYSNNSFRTGITTVTYYANFLLCIYPLTCLGTLNYLLSSPGPMLHHLNILLVLIFHLNKFSFIKFILNI